MMYTMDISINQSAFPDSDPKPSKRRRKKSMVWEHFTIETINPDCIKANCNQCKKSFAYISGSKLAGTSHLKRHITMGICPVTRHNNQEKDQLNSHSPPPKTKPSANGTNPPRKRHKPANTLAIYSGGGGGDNWSHDLAKMIIQHDYPLHMVEHSGFIDFARTLQPQFNITSPTTVQEQILGIYMREKKMVMDLLSVIPGRLNLTVDLWTSDKSLSYVLLTGHFTDHDWKLQRRILNFMIVQNPDSDTAFNDNIAACLTDWNLDEKLFTVTLNRSNGNEIASENLRNSLSVRNPVTLNGRLLISSCYARMLTSLALDAMGSMKETIDKVRQSVMYVKLSEAHEESFVRLKQQLQVPSTKNLMTDDLTKWNTTYQMLVAASELKEVFSCLDTFDPDYKLTPPSFEEWGQVETLCKFLKMFLDAANILTTPVCLTGNSFDEARKIHLELMQAAASHDLFKSTLTKPLNEKFTKYWNDCNLVLAIAAVMDPRFKMKVVEFSFSRIYGEDADTWIKIVSDGVHELYLQYVMQSHLLGPTSFMDEPNDPLVKTEMLCQEDSLLSSVDGLIDFDIDISDIMGDSSHTKLEIDQYLEESVLPRNQDFDALGWWKVNSAKYPTLSRLACDVLSIPLSTVPPECVFDTRERKVDNYQCSLRPNTLEALLCAKDWLRYGSTTEFSTLGVSSAIVAAGVKSEFCL